MSRTASSGQQGIRPGSHYAPYSVHTRRDINSASMQAGSNTSPELFVSVVAGACGEEKPPFSFPASGASFKRGEVIQSLIDVGAAIFAFLFIALVGLSITTAILILLFVVSFH